MATREDVLRKLMQLINKMRAGEYAPSVSANFMTSLLNQFEGMGLGFTVNNSARVTSTGHLPRLASRAAKQLLSRVVTSWLSK